MIEPVTITHPRLPEALDGMTIAHVSDLHIRRDQWRYQKLISDINLRGPDLVLLTGDYMTDVGDEPAAHQVMTRLCGGLRPRLGAYACFGNHDTPEMRRLAAEWDVTLLVDQRLRLTIGRGKPAIEIWGLNDTYAGFGDVARLLQAPQVEARAAEADANDEPANPGQTFRIVLAHNPQILPAVADLHADLMLSGHTHGGQIRLLPHLVLANSCDLPLNLSTGLLRHQSTLCAISRGVGEVIVPIRWLCPSHVPLYTLRRGAMLGQPGPHVQQVLRW